MDAELAVVVDEASRTTVPGPMWIPAPWFRRTSTPSISQPLLAEIAPVCARLPNFSTVRFRICTPAPPEIPAPATESSSFLPVGSSAR